jgi:hypothetical protein
VWARAICYARAVRRLVLVILVGCQSSTTPDVCERAVDHVLEIKRSVNKQATPESAWQAWRAQMVPYCRDKLVAEDRNCLLEIKTMEDLGACMDKVTARLKDSPRTPDR